MIKTNENKDNQRYQSSSLGDAKILSETVIFCFMLFLSFYFAQYMDINVIAEQENFLIPLHWTLR